MWWVRLFIILITYLTGYLDISDVKVWKFSSNKQNGHSHSHSRERHSHIELNNKSTIHYDLNALRQMEIAVHHDQWLKILPFDAIKTIRSLGLNVKPKGKRRHERHGFKQLRVNRANLVTIKKIPKRDPNIIIATINVQSLKMKELQVSELINDHGIDILALTETWLTNKENDKN